MVAERKNRSLKEMATCLLQVRNIPSYLWYEALNCASYLHNRVPHKSVVGVTPFEALHENNPNVSHLIVFRSKPWARIPLHKWKAFQAQSTECILLVYVEDAKACKLMEVATKRCFIERRFQLKEDQLYDTPPAAQEGITISTPILYNDDVL